jgi:hypothetical protein
MRFMEDAENQLGHFAADLLFGERLDDDRGARADDHGASEQALERGPTERRSHLVPKQQQQAALDDGDDPAVGAMRTSRLRRNSSPGRTSAG